MFLGKFTDEEIAEFEQKRTAAVAEVEGKYADEIAAETARLEAEIESAKEAKDADARKTAQRELADYLKRMQETKTHEARAMLKERFGYPIFLYEQIEAAARTAVGNYAIGSDDIGAIQFPLPPASVQQTMMNRVDTGRSEIAKLKADAKARADAAKADLEAMILGVKPVQGE